MPIGELSALGAALVWGGSLLVFRRFGSGVPPGSMNLYKNAVGTIFLGILLLALPHELFSVGPQAAMYLMLSGVIGITIGDTFFFGALSRLGAQLTAVSQCLSPVAVTILAWIFLSETMTPFEITGLLLTLLGVGGAVWTGNKDKSNLARDYWMGLLLALLSAISNAAGVLFARMALSECGPLEGTFIRVFAATVFLVPLVRLTKPSFKIDLFLAPKKRAWGLFFASFSSAGIGFFLMSVGLKFSKAGVASALSMTYPIWIIPMAYFSTGEKVTLMASFCSCLAVVGAALIFIH